MRIAITGSSGMIGTGSAGRTERRPARGSSGWSGGHRSLPTRFTGTLPQVGWTLHISRESRRSSTSPAPMSAASDGLKAYKRTLRDSRLGATRTLATALTETADRPRVLVSMSAAGIYGLAHGSEILDDDEPPGDGFLADMCQEWEAAADRPRWPASPCAIRVRT